MILSVEKFTKIYLLPSYHMHAIPLNTAWKLNWFRAVHFQTKLELKNIFKLDSVIKNYSLSRFWIFSCHPTSPTSGPAPGIIFKFWKAWRKLTACIFITKLTCLSQEITLSSHLSVKNNPIQWYSFESNNFQTFRGSLSFFYFIFCLFWCSISSFIIGF